MATREKQSSDVEGFVIEAADLRRRYGGERGYEAVAGVDIRVRRGEVFALLGTNGAGKTSTVELLEGLANPTAGTVRVLGLDPVRDRAALRPRIGVMLQAGGFAKELTVAETCRMWRGCTPGARPADEVLAMVGLAARRNVRIKQLSGGECRRLDLGLALLGRPEVLFLDEPTTGMDPEGRKETWDTVKLLRQEGTTVLLTTHYLAEAEALADRVAIMRAGRVVAAGTPDEVVAAHPATISFELPVGLSPEALPALSGVSGMETTARLVRLQTDRLQTTLTEVLDWARDREVRLGRLDARSASLEEAFLAIAAEAEPVLTTGGVR